jgi:hypothetical protein
VSGYSYVGGVCGYNYSTITACYNTGSVTVESRLGIGPVGGVCGYNSSTITACYNTGSVSGNSQVGGVCGYDYSNSTITACYNTGSVSGNSYVGGVCGYNSSSSIIACYWKDITGDKADYGIGNNIAGTSIFALVAWPTPETHQQWGTGYGSGDGKYWKSLGSWNGGNPIYPKLWFEE